MFDLVQAGVGSWYIDCPAKIGIWVQDGDAWLIDSGNDKDAGRRVRKLLDEKGWALKAIVNTHSHADHIGGNAYLQKQTGCAVYAPGIEADFTRHPLLEPAVLFGGNPPKDLRHKFLLAQPSDAQELCEGVLPEGFTVIPLPGHSPGQVGYKTPDGTVFLADCVSSVATLEKYRLTFLFDVGQHLQTLESICALEGTLFVPSHAGATDDITGLAVLNCKATEENVELLAGLCASPTSFENLLQKVFAHFGMRMSFDQNVLVGSTVKAYLTYLHECGRAAVSIEDNKLLWQVAQ